jgi:hypothetical protein
VNARAARLVPILIVTAAVALPRCGGGSGGTTPTPPVTASPAPSRANISIAVANPLVSSGGVPGFAHSLRFGLHLAESAGIGVNLNAIGLAVFDVTGARLELTEVGASAIPGGNRLGANASRDFDLAIGFNSDPLPGRFAHVLVDTTDDRGNSVLVPSERLFF